MKNMNATLGKFYVFLEDIFVDVALHGKCFYDNRCACESQSEKDSVRDLTKLLTESYHND